MDEVSPSTHTHPDSGSSEPPRLHHRLPLRSSHTSEALLLPRLSSGGAPGLLRPPTPRAPGDSAQACRCARRKTWTSARGTPWRCGLVGSGPEEQGGTLGAAAASQELRGWPELEQTRGSEAPWEAVLEPRLHTSHCCASCRDDRVLTAAEEEAETSEQAPGL